MQYVALPAHEVARHLPRPKHGKRTWGKALQARLQSVPWFPTEAQAREALGLQHVPLSVFRETMIGIGYEHKNTRWTGGRWCPMSFG